MSKATEGRETEIHCKAQHWNQSVLVHAGNALLTTATALEDKSSWGDMAVKYAMLVNVYTNVTNGMDMNMARGRFLIKELGG